MQYDRVDISADQMPRAASPVFQHVVDTYASETNKTVSVWRLFTAADLSWRPHAASGTVEDIMKHQLLSERRFFAEFLGSSEPDATAVLPDPGITAYASRLVELASSRLVWLSAVTEGEWLQRTKFFDVERERIWIFWRRILHTAHHRTQLTVYLRLLNRAVPPTYGPTADVTWSGADPTLTVDAS